MTSQRRTHRRDVDPTLRDVGPAFRPLLVAVLERAGDDCRFVVRYDTDSTHLAYLRDDLLGGDLLPRIDAVTERARGDDTAPEHARGAYGDQETTVDVYEDALVLHFRGPAGENEGLIAAVDRSPGAVGRLLGK